MRQLITNFSMIGLIMTSRVSNAGTHSRSFSDYSNVVRNECKPAEKFSGDKAYIGCCYDTLKGAGNIGLKNTEIKQILKVVGDTTIHESKIKSAKLVGQVQTFDSTFEDQFNATGSTLATKTIFKSLFEVVADHSRLNDCNNQDIKFSSGDRSRDEVLDLERTMVNGNIEFTNQRGKIYKDQGSTIRGRVIGGEVIPKE